MLIFRPWIPVYKQGLIFTGWLLKIIPQLSQKPGMCYWHDHGTQISHAEGFRTLTLTCLTGLRQTGKSVHTDLKCDLIKNYGIFWGIMKERETWQRPTCQELTFQGKLSLSRGPWLVIGSCFGVFSTVITCSDDSTQIPLNLTQFTTV